jgi:hypothetical protein
MPLLRLVLVLVVLLLVFMVLPLSPSSTLAPQSNAGDGCSAVASSKRATAAPHGGVSTKNGGGGAFRGPSPSLLLLLLLLPLRPLPGGTGRGGASRLTRNS